MVARFDILNAISEADHQLLKDIADEVNKRHFGGQVVIELRWGIPSASERTAPKIEIDKLSILDQERLLNCIRMFNKRDLDGAKTGLKPLVDQGQREASQLYVRTLQLLKDPTWPDVARSINRACMDSIFVPPGSVEFVDRKQVILIHPTLSTSTGKRAPRYVLRYVIFHEFLHKWLDTKSDDPHPEIFRKMDSAFNCRAKAVSWLKKNNFSTIEDESK